MEHSAALGLCPDPVDLDDDRARHEILAFEMNPAAMFRPASRDEAADRDGSGDHCKNQAGVVARNLQTEQLQGRYSLSAMLSALIASVLKFEVQNVQIPILDFSTARRSVNHARVWLGTPVRVLSPRLSHIASRPRLRIP